MWQSPFLQQLEHLSQDMWLRAVFQTLLSVFIINAMTRPPAKIKRCRIACDCYRIAVRSIPDAPDSASTLKLIRFPLLVYYWLSCGGY